MLQNILINLHFQFLAEQRDYFKNFGCIYGNKFILVTFYENTWVVIFYSPL